MTLIMMIRMMGHEDRDGDKNDDDNNDEDDADDDEYLYFTDNVDNTSACARFKYDSQHI